MLEGHEAAQDVGFRCGVGEILKHTPPLVSESSPTYPMDREPAGLGIIELHTNLVGKDMHTLCGTSPRVYCSQNDFSVAAKIVEHTQLPFLVLLPFFCCSACSLATLSMRSLLVAN